MLFPSPENGIPYGNGKDSSIFALDVNYFSRTRRVAGNRRFADLHSEKDNISIPLGVNATL